MEVKSHSQHSKREKSESLKLSYSENQIRDTWRTLKWGEWEQFAQDYHRLMKQLRKRKVHLRRQMILCLSETGDPCSFLLIKNKFYQKRGARHSGTNIKLLKKHLKVIWSVYKTHSLCFSDVCSTVQLYLKSPQRYRITPGDYWPVNVNGSSNQKNKTLGRWW